MMAPAGGYLLEPVLTGVHITVPALPGVQALISLEYSGCYWLVLVYLLLYFLYNHTYYSPIDL